MSTKDEAAEIRRLNDQLRCCGTGGRITITRGIASVGADMLVRIMWAVVTFDAFTPDNDPYGEHDCAILEIDGVRVLWKIDYYDLTLSMHSPNPAHPDLTIRLLTVMLAEEY